MNEAFTVGGIFAIDNQASPVLKVIGGQLDVLDAKLEHTATLFREMIPGGISRRILTIGTAYNEAAASAEKAGTRMAEAMRVSNDAMLKNAEGFKAGLATSFAGVEAAAKKQAGDVRLAWAGAFTGIETGVEESTDIIAKGMSRISRGAGRAARNVDALRLQLSHLATSNFDGISHIPMPNVPRIGGGGGGGGMGPRARRGDGAGGHGGGFHFSGESVRTPVGHIRGSGGMSNTAIGAAVLIGDAVIQGAELEDVVTKILINSQLNPGEAPLTRNDDGKRIADLVKRGAAISGFSIKDVGEMVLGTEREFQGMTFDKKTDTLTQMLPAISAEARLRDEPLKEAGESLIGVLHQAGLFTPEEMVKGAKEFQFTTMATPVGLSQFKNALSYSMTPLHGGLGMDTGTVMLLTSLMQSAGVSNSKAGTWTRSLFVGAEPSTDVLGPLTKTQVQHNEALKMLGLVGEDGKQNWKVNGADGKTDWNSSVIKMFQELHGGMQNIPEGQRADVLHRAFGTQGAGAATLFSQENIIDQLAILKQKMGAFTGGDVSLSEYSQGSTLQRFRETTQQFQVLMADLGTTILPAVNKSLGDLGGILKLISGQDWKGLAKNFYDHAIKPDIDPILKQVLPSEGDLKLKNLDPSADASGLDAMRNGLLHKESFVIGGTANDNSPMVDMLAQGVFKGLQMYANGGGAAGGMGGGGGIINASYGGGGGFGGGGGDSPLLRGARGVGGYGNLVDGPVGQFNAGGSFGQKSPEVMRRLMTDFGLDAPQAAKILGNLGHESIGFKAFNEIGGGGGIGWAQWTGPRNREFRAWSAANHLDPHSDEANYGFLKHELSGKYARGIAYLKAGGSLEGFEQIFEVAGVKAYGSRHAYERAALAAYNSSHATVAAPRPRVTPGGPAAAAGSGAGMPPIHLHHTTVLDGKVVARNTIKHVASAMAHPTTTGGPTGRTHYTHAGTPITDAA